MSEYDLVQRERIREALFAYMKEHRIGIPTLAIRIKEKLPRNETIPDKTLQRFMKGEHRTNDTSVGFLAQFIETISKKDASPQLGAALNAFYSSADKTDWSGRFALTEKTDANQTSTSKFDVISDRGSWRVKETRTDEGTSEIYDGVMAASGPTWIIVLKDRLLGLPRSMTIRSVGGNRYNGVATAAFVPRHASTYIWHAAVETRHARVQMEGIVSDQ